MEQSKVLAIWDPLVRAFHWLLVIGYVLSYFTQVDRYGLHLIAGYSVLGLLVFRVLWGIVGSKHARFADFVRGPGEIFAYLGAFARAVPPRYLGHNPAGGAMIVALLCCLLVVAGSGIALDAAENRAGPLGHTMLFLYADRISGIHLLSTNVSLALIAVHITGVLVTSLFHKENLVGAMITGRKKA